MCGGFLYHPVSVPEKIPECGCINVKWAEYVFVTGYYTITGVQYNEDYTKRSILIKFKEE